MKKLILLLSFLLATLAISAQSEIPSDSIQRAPDTHIKDFGGFLLDMNLMKIDSRQFAKFKLDLPDLTKDYNTLFQLNPDAIYSQGYSNAFFSTSGFRYGWGLSSSSQYMQMGSFRLRNGMRINTYGDYNANGWRVPNRSAMPWEKNNFRGAFELKSANGAFGIRIEVQQGRNSLY